MGSSDHFTVQKETHIFLPSCEGLTGFTLGTPAISAYKGLTGIPLTFTDFES